ncbi:verrucotoxin subunit beta-like isoform X2 [Tachysurus vachellii]|uniref:verrucotoxin subunit beta-like isoform X2 n=1 Tax=Tachysurus vachellii TaxID=175792 RepID=UPI00296B4C55|nr:verrucotoxin subunit beta-like isoform X2 [Tachysurus vachellii]
MEHQQLSLNMASVREHIIETVALGRPLQLGMLYDCRNDSIVPGITLWDQQQLQHNKDVRPQHNTEFTVATSDTIQTQQSKQLKVDGELKLSLLCGIISVSGAARYFNDTKKSFIQQRLTLHYKTTTKFEQLTMEHLAQGQIDHHELFDHDMATHVVVAVLYGADAYFVLDKEMNLSDETKDVQGDVKIAADKLKFLCFTGAQVELNMNEHEKAAVGQMNCTFYGDFKLSSNPTTFEGAVKVYHDLPKMLGENGEHAVPVKVWLYPLDKLDSRAAKPQRNISTDLIRAVESVIEDLNATSMRCGDLMEDTVAKTFGTFHNLVQDFQKFCTEYKKDFMINLRSILPEIRGGKTDIKDLSELLESHEKSPFRSCDVQQWITMKEEKSNQIKALLKQLKELGAEVNADRDKYLLDLNVENLVSYTFTCLQHPEPLLTQQEIYLKPSTVKKPSENTLSLDFQEKSWTLEELKCMKNNLKIFKDLINLNKSNKNTRFIVESVPQTPDKPGSCVLIYENGCSEVTCFVPPSKPKPPTVEYVTDNSIRVKMSSLCAATLRMQLLHKMEQENSWKSQTVTDESVTLSNLNAGTDYEIKCAAVGKIDYKVESDVTVTTTTGSVIISHGAKSHQAPAQTLGRTVELSGSQKEEGASEFDAATDQACQKKKELEDFKKEILEKKSLQLCTNNELIIATELKLVLLGGDESNNTAAKNIIIGKEEMSNAAACTATVTQQSESTQDIAGIKVMVVDLDSPELSLDELSQTLEPQAFLLVIPVKYLEDKVLSEDETQMTLRKMEKIFGMRYQRYTLILFTVSDELQKKKIEELIQSKDQKLEKVLEKCGNRFYCLNIKESGDGSQVSELLKNIEKMVEGNRNGSEKYQIISNMKERHAQIRKMQSRIHKALEKSVQFDKEFENDLKSLEKIDNSEPHVKIVTHTRSENKIKIEIAEQMEIMFNTQPEENRQFIKAILPGNQQPIWLSLPDEETETEKYNMLQQLEKKFSKIMESIYW